MRYDHSSYARHGAHRRRRARQRFYIITAVAVLILTFGILLLAGVFTPGTPSPVPSGSPQPLEPEPSASAEPSPTPRGSGAVTMHVVGDIMCHINQLTSAEQEDGTYDFTPWFSEISKELKKADLVIGNLETTTFDASTKGYAGYPLFNTPSSLLDALKGAGFTHLTTANNHCLDRWIDGARATIDEITKRGFWQTGTFKSPEHKAELPVIEHDGLRIAYMAYTSGCNGMEHLVDQNDVVYTTNIMEKETMLADIRRAKDAGVDFIVLSLHWGTEYVRQPDASQRELAEELLMAGADIILGSHPHMLQPITRKTITDNDGKTRDVAVVYSLGNFISDQRAQYKDTGMMVRLGLEKNFDTGEKKITELSYLPTWVHRTSVNSKYAYRILPAGAWADDAALRSELGATAASRVQAAWKEATELIGEEAAVPLRTVSE